MLLCSTSLVGQRPAQRVAPLVFDGATVVDVEHGRLLPRQRVVVQGNRIRALGSARAVSIPKGAQVVGARGKYLIPGLWDMHAHPYGYVDIAYPLFIANGVTGMRDAASPVPLATLAQWKREITAGTRVGPRLIVSGPAINGIESWPDANGASPVAGIQHGKGRVSHWIYVPPTAAVRAVDSLQAAGADMLKFYGMSPALRWALAAEARRVGIPFGGHWEDVSGTDFSDSGATILDHWQSLPKSCYAAEVFDRSQCAAWGQHLRRNNTWIMSQVWIYTWASLARALRYTPDSVAASADVLSVIKADPRLRGSRAALDSLATAQQPTSSAEWLALLRKPDEPELGLREFLPPADTQRQITPLLPIVAGSDAGIGNPVATAFPYIPGFTLPEVLEIYVLRDGLTPLEALQTATLNPALALRATDSLGTVTQGKLADLVLLDADPLMDIWNVTKIRAVVANGRYFDRRALDGLLQTAARAAGH